MGFSVCGQSVDNVRDCILETATIEVGTRELTGNNDGERVELYITTSGFSKDSQIPWCAAFVYWCYLNCGIDVDVRYPAFSPAYFPRERIVWSGNGAYKGKVQPGDLAGFYYAGLNRIGHVAIIVQVYSTFFVTVEGNTNGSGGREGDGVYFRKRLKRQVRYVSNWIDEIY